MPSVEEREETPQRVNLLFDLDEFMKRESNEIHSIALQKIMLN